MFTTTTPSIPRARDLFFLPLSCITAFQPYLFPWACALHGYLSRGSKKVLRLPSGRHVPPFLYPPVPITLAIKFYDERLTQQSATKHAANTKKNKCVHPNGGGEMNFVSPDGPLGALRSIDFFLQRKAWLLARVIDIFLFGNCGCPTFKFS